MEVTYPSAPLVIEAAFAYFPFFGKIFSGLAMAIQTPHSLDSPSNMHFNIGFADTREQLGTLNHIFPQL